MLISGPKKNPTSDGTVNKFAFLKVFRRGASVFMRKQCHTSETQVHETGPLLMLSEHSELVSVLLVAISRPPHRLWAVSAFPSHPLSS